MKRVESLFRLLSATVMLLGIVVAGTGCAEEAAVQLPAVSVDPQLSEDMEILESAGFDVSDLVDLGDSYLVEGDISILKSQLSHYQLETRQARTPGMVAETYWRNGIVVAVDSSMPTYGVHNWRPEIETAINHWNNIDPDCGLKLIYSPNATNWDIKIYSNYIGPTNLLGQGSPPYITGPGINSIPGQTVTFNLNYGGSLSSLVKVYNAVHELGHNIGFRHTNWDYIGESYAEGIPTTPNGGDPDRLSVMNGYTAQNSWNGFSAYDKAAAKQLFPKSLVKTMTINGDNAVEINKTEQYTLITTMGSQLYPISNISWSCPQGMTIVSGNGTGSVVVSGSTPGNKTLTATFMVNGTTYNATKNINFILPLDPGTLSPASQTINHGMTPNLNYTSPSGGTGQYSAKWLYKLSYSSIWTVSSSLPVLNNTGSTSQTWHFKRSVTSGTEIKETNQITVIVNPDTTFRPGFINSQPFCFSGQVPQLAVTGATGGQYGYVYIWNYKLTGTSTWTANPNMPVFTAPGSSPITYDIRCEVIAPGPTTHRGYTPTITYTVYQNLTVTGNLGIRSGPVVSGRAPDVAIPTITGGLLTAPVTLAWYYRLQGTSTWSQSLNTVPVFTSTNYNTVYEMYLLVVRGPQQHKTNTMSMLVLPY